MAELAKTVEDLKMAERLLNKVAVVTGASGVHGRAIVRRLLEEGAKVVVFARNRGRLEELASLAPARVLPVDGDVTKTSDLEMLAETTARRFGGVDILIPAAGRVVSATLEECTPEVVSQILGVNLQSALQTVRAFAGNLNRGASIIFLTASRAQPSCSGLGPFAASKAALASFAQTLAVELFPRRIRVNCVATAIQKSKSAGAAAKADDVADVVLFFASNESAGVTGQQLTADAACRGPASSSAGSI
jgi:NAD(P)-dependent dehydrogenase (short-subunit alcohol dehydrogenase family)